MPSINSINLHRFTQGHVQPLGRATMLKERPGGNGYDVLYPGFKSAPFTMNSFSDYDSDNDRHAAWLTFLALKGTPTTLIDNNARSWSNVLVLDAERITENYAAAAGGLTAGIYGLTINWTLQSI